ncbi:MAG TPA: protoporphyrinogen oxidase [Streptosporangiaceae bacterium]|nr:protoporphyrinogen oxidase [Streptosporangiaceae bacterium]
MDQPGARPVVAIIGGGIAGLAAAFFLRDEPVRAVVLEGSPRLGGKLFVAEVAGCGVDVGAEALLARRPEGTDLIRAAGLGAGLVSPGTTAARIWTRGAMRRLPARQYMGVPADVDELAQTGLLSPEGLARASRELGLPATPRDGDVPVASYVAARFGQEVVDRLVDPLLGGVYAGRSEELSFEATLPGLAGASRQRASLAEAAALLLPPPQPAGAGPAGAGPAGAGPAGAGSPGTGPAGTGRPPMFTTLAGGLGVLPAALAAASGAEVRTSAMVRELVPAAHGWRLTIGSAHAPERLDADAVILALPGRPAGRLLADVPGAAAAGTALGEISYASMAIVTLAYPDTAFPQLPDTSGYLVPAVDGHPVKAVTFSSVKWPHLRTRAAGLVFVRCSVGRIGEEAILQRDDSELAAIAAADLAAATGVQGTPADARVTRWGGALPQYTVGHLDRVARIQASLAAQPGLAACGAAYAGVGIPACIATAREAADQVLTGLRAGSTLGDARQ